MNNFSPIILEISLTGFLELAGIRLGRLKKSMVTFRTLRNSLLVLPLLLGSAVVPTVQAGKADDETNRPSMEWKGSDDFQFPDRAFSPGSRLFYAGPQWFLNALPGSTRAHSRYFLDQAGDPADSYTPYNSYVGTLRDVFDVGLFNIYKNSSTFAGPSTPKTSNPLIANTTGGPGVFYLGSSGNWDAVGAWGPDANMYPNAQSAVATDLQVVSGSIVQNVVAGIALGIIDHNPTTAGNSGLAVSWTITTDNLIVMNNGLSPAQINNSQAVGNNSLTINGAAGLSLTSELSITNANATGLITISAPMVGNGGITVGGIGTTLLTGDNTFYGATIINSGATLNAGAAHSLGGGGSGLTLGLGTSSVTVNAGGTLLFSGSTTDRIKNDAPINLNGGTLNTAGLSEYTAGSVLPGMGALTLASASTIDLGSVASIIAFADSHLAGWSGVLKIVNWSGSLSGNGLDQIYFGTNTSGLTAQQLSQISFYSDATGTVFLGFGSWAQDNDGEVVPLAPVPEPSTWVIGALALSAIFFTRRRRARR